MAMATIATFTIPTEPFPLGNVFTAHPGVTVELERVIPTNKAIIPYFWCAILGRPKRRKLKTRSDIIQTFEASLQLTR